MDPNRDLVLAILGGAVGLSGLLLVFVGFVFAKTESSSVSRDTTQYRRVARGGITPLLCAIACAWLSLEYLEGSQHLLVWVVLLFRTSLATILIYALVVMLFFM